MPSGRSTAGKLEVPDPEAPDASEELPALVLGLERRLLAALAIALVLVLAAYAWLRPDLSNPSDRQAVLLGLVSLLSLLTVTGLGLVIPTISNIREGFRRRDAARERMIHQLEARSRRLEDYSRELERRNNDLRRFAYVVAHDLREPARTVSTHAELARRNAGDRIDPEANEELDRAVQAAQHLDELLGDLLVYVTLDQHVGEREPADLEEVVSDALTRLEADLDRGEARIEVGELPTVRVDRATFVRLFEELLGNALKFASEDEAPRVEVDAETREEAWVIEVSDDGIGMDPSHGDRVFSMFERLHTREEFAGTGAGLAICRRIAELHSGGIEIDTERGEGTTVRVRIPRRTGTEIEPEPLDPHLPARATSGGHD